MDIDVGIGQSAGVRRTLVSLLAVAMTAGVLAGCSDEEKGADPPSVPTNARATGNFVCFKIAGDPGLDRFNAFVELVRQYPPASGHAIAAGYKQDAAVSVKLQPGENPSTWIEQLPDALRHHAIVNSVDAEDHDCGEVKA